MAITIVGQKPATLATGVDLTNDTTIGVTNPNLHRRVDNVISCVGYAVVGEARVLNSPFELHPRTYLLGIYNDRSYRTTITYVHDEDSTTSEVP